MSASKRTGITIGILAAAALAVVLISWKLQSVSAPKPIEQAERLRFVPLEKKGLPQSSVDLFEQALAKYQSDPVSKSALLNMGYVYIEAGQYTEAERAFRVFLKFDATDQEAQLGAARALIAQGKTVDAEHELLDLLSRDPFYHFAYSELLNLYSTGKVAPSREPIDRIEKGRMIDKKGEYTDYFNELSKSFSQLLP